jgi:formylglycine-generating enzyme required for sulfatase activity
VRIGLAGLLFVAAFLGAGAGAWSQLRAGALSSFDPDVRVESSPIVWIPEGPFTMGASESDLSFAIELCQDEHELAVAEGCTRERFAHELPPRRVYLRAFGIDRTEVTQAAWRRCVAAGRCVPPRVTDADARFGADALPVVAIRWDEAARYCEFVGGRLPTEEEWEKAARGDSRRRFPWGRRYHSRLANHGRPPRRPDPGDGYRFAAPVGSFPDGASPYGVLDMAGNVWEWTASAPTARDFEVLGHRGADPGVYRILRGGSWAHPAVALRVTHRAFMPATDARSDVGVRCAYDPTEWRGERAMPGSWNGGFRPAILRPLLPARSSALGFRSFRVLRRMPCRRLESPFGTSCSPRAGSLWRAARRPKEKSASSTPTARAGWSAASRLPRLRCAASARGPAPGSATGAPAAWTRAARTRVSRTRVSRTRAATTRMRRPVNRTPAAPRTREAAVPRVPTPMGAHRPTPVPRSMPVARWARATMRVSGRSIRVCSATPDRERARRR